MTLALSFDYLKDTGTTTGNAYFFLLPIGAQGIEAFLQ